MAYRHVNEVVVSVWGDEVGVLYPDSEARRYLFEYDPRWAQRGIELAPLTMPVSRARDIFGPPAIATEDDNATWHRVPAMVADSVPDDFGNAVINSVLAREGVAPEQISALDRLAYVGTRGMGALTFEPDRAPRLGPPTAIEMSDLVEQARLIVTGGFQDENSRGRAMADIILTGTSAGGARPKAVIAWNRETNEVRAGNLPVPDGFEQWLLKFDGVRKGSTQLERSLGFTQVEYAYSLMARDAGIDMSDTTLLDEGGRSHFLTRRFDRPGINGDRLHVQTLNAFAQMNFKHAGAHSYESVMLALQRAQIDTPDATEQVFRRAVFNTLASNNDDHTKNMAFLMDKSGQWSLSPAYDITFAYEPDHQWIGRHFLSINGKHSDVTVTDLREFANAATWQVPGYAENIERSAQAVSRWGTYAREAGVSDDDTAEIDAHIKRILRESGVVKGLVGMPAGKQAIGGPQQATCGVLVKRTGKPCILRKGHGGSHRSVLVRR